MRDEQGRYVWTGETIIEDELAARGETYDLRNGRHGPVSVWRRYIDNVIASVAAHGYRAHGEHDPGGLQVVPGARALEGITDFTLAIDHLDRVWSDGNDIADEQMGTNWAELLDVAESNRRYASDMLANIPEERYEYDEALHYQVARDIHAYRAARAS